MDGREPAAVPPASPPALPPSPETPLRVRLPRAGTFRAQRPLSTGSGLRRGTTFSHRPQSYSGIPSPLLRDPQDNDEPILRRSALSKPSSPNDRPLRRLSVRDTSRLPRAGTFSGASSATLPKLPVTDDMPLRRMSSADRLSRRRTTCGMCGNCTVGSKAMPPWAPERLRGLTAPQRAHVLQELRQKEEKGRLEAELRRKRLSDMQAVSARLEARRADSALFRMDSSRTEELEPMRFLSGRLEQRASEEFGEMESVDLGIERGISRKATSKRGRPMSGSMPEVGVVRVVPEVVTEHVEEKMDQLDDDCGQWDGLEIQVSDLEEQLGVLREVVNICSQTETEREGKIGGNLERVNSKKPKSWKDKMLDAYYGNSSSANERARLKEEVEALRKATDFLSAKMQQEAK